MLYICHYVGVMNRTSIMLPSDLKAQAMDQAHKSGLSLGEYIRKALKKMLLEAKKKKSIDPFFEDKATFRGSSPSDLAARHDDYLYGDK
jgi:hypothetical protein